MTRTHVIRAVLSTDFIRRCDDRWDRSVALVLGAFDRSGDAVLWLARLWSRVILGVPGVQLEVKIARPAGSGPALRVHAQPRVDGRHLGGVRRRPGVVSFHRQEAAVVHSRCSAGR